MIFLVFGTDKNPANLKKKQAIQWSYNYFVAVEQYKAAIRLYKYTHVYLVVDFGTYKKKFNDPRYISIEYNEGNELPFYIIAENHTDLECDYSIANFDQTFDNTMILSTKGIDHVFRNSFYGMEKFLFFLQNRIECVMSICYQNSTDKEPFTIHRKVVSTKDLLLRENLGFLDKKGYSVKRFKLETKSWIACDEPHTIKKFTVPIIPILKQEEPKVVEEQPLIVPEEENIEELAESI